MSNDLLKQKVEEINNQSDEVEIGKARRHAGFSVVQFPSRLLMVDVALDGGIPRGKIMRIFGNESTGKTTTLTKIFASAQRTCRNCNSELITEDVTRYEVFDKVQDDTLFIDEDFIESNEEFESLEFPNYYDKEEISENIVELKKIITNELGKNVKRYDIRPYRRIKVEDCTLCDDPEPMNCVHLDAERDWDNDWADACGVDTEEVFVIQTQSTEESIDRVTELMKTGEMDVFGLDSWAALTPEKELSNQSEEGEDQTMGDQAKLANKALRKWITTLASEGIDTENRPTMILLNQYRMDINVSFGDPRTTPGGKGQEFASSVDIEMLSPDDESESGEMSRKDKKIYKKDLKFNIKKNKMVTEGRRGYYSIYTRDRPEDGYYAGDTSEEEDVLDFARDFKILEKDGSNYVWKEEDLEESTLTALKEKIKDDTALYSKIRQEVIEILK